MNALPYKSKQYGLIAVKLILLGLTLFYVIGRLTDQDAHTSGGIRDGFKGIELPFLMVILLLAAVNWWLESLKWKYLVNPIRPIGIGEAVKQTLSGLTLSLATPARIGDFGVKAAYFPKSERKAVLIKNTFSHGTQLMATLIFGGIGLYMMSSLLQSYIHVGSLLPAGMILLILILSGHLVWRYKLSGKRALLKTSKIGVKVLVLSVIRYHCFSLTFALLLNLQGVDLPLYQTLPLIWVTYLLSSVVPSFLLLDVAIKGGVAVWLFSLLGVAAWPVICAASLMWLFNMILPALIGVWFSIRYRPSYR